MKTLPNEKSLTTDFQQTLEYILRSALTELETRNDKVSYMRIEANGNIFATCESSYSKVKFFNNFVIHLTAQIDRMYDDVKYDYYTKFNILEKYLLYFAKKENMSIVKSGKEYTIFFENLNTI